ncbi:hypothetical protein DFH27DRAFT_553044 [Peziza echinospora]|nr:hypothetical protein DFH27DRAFT_553044 [Peziza echinospora]
MITRSQKKKRAIEFEDPGPSKRVETCHNHHDGDTNELAGPPAITTSARSPIKNISLIDPLPRSTLLGNKNSVEFYHPSINIPDDFFNSDYRATIASIDWGYLSDPWESLFYAPIGSHSNKAKTGPAKVEAITPNLRVFLKYLKLVKTTTSRPNHNEINRLLVPPNAHMCSEKATTTYSNCHNKHLIMYGTKGHGRHRKVLGFMGHRLMHFHMDVLGDASCLEIFALYFGRLQARECTSSECVKNRTWFEGLAPKCRWKGLRRLFVQVAACWYGWVDHPGGGRVEMVNLSRIVDQIDFQSDYVFQDLSLERVQLFSIQTATSTSQRGKGDREIHLDEISAICEWFRCSTRWGYAVASLPTDDLAFSTVTPHLEDVVATCRVLKLCPKRLMALIESLPGGTEYLPLLLGELAERPVMAPEGANRHEECILDHCVYDVINYTNVSQLHKCGSLRTLCRMTEVEMFPRAPLDEAALAGQPTAWALDGRTLLRPGQRYMAVSHIWADGTGVGTSPGRANECLFAYFAGIARSIEGCEGIWWDAVCIPAGRRAKAAVLDRMHDNYSLALFTLVHDRFLLGMPWRADGSPCMAIIFSPWFGRGWTALELVKSRKVVVQFGNGVLKDLDTEIMAQYNGPCSIGQRIATWIISKLRRPAKTINDLLVMLKARTTSWAADMPIIAALLADVHIASITNLSQLKINEAILLKLPIIRVENFFHTGVPGAGKFAWCPSSLFDLKMENAAIEDKQDITCDKYYPTLYTSGETFGHWNAVIPTNDRYINESLVVTPATTNSLFMSQISSLIQGARNVNGLRKYIYLLCRERLGGPLSNFVPAIMVEVLKERPYALLDPIVRGEISRRIGHFQLWPRHHRLSKSTPDEPYLSCRFVGCVYVSGKDVTHSSEVDPNIRGYEDLNYHRTPFNGVHEMWILMTCDQSLPGWSSEKGSSGSFGDYVLNKIKKNNALLFW